MLHHSNSSTLSQRLVFLFLSAGFGVFSAGPMLGQDKSDSSVILAGDPIRDCASELLNEAVELWLASDRDQDLGVSIVKQLALNCDLDSALTALEKTGVPADKHGFTSFSIRKRLIQLHVHRGNTNEALKLVGDLPTDARTADDFHERQYLFSRALAERGNFDEALKYADRIKNESTLIDGSTVNGSYRRTLAFYKLMRLMAKNGHSQRAKQAAILYSSTSHDRDALFVVIAQSMAKHQGAENCMKFLRSNFKPEEVARKINTVAQRLSNRQQFRRAMELLRQPEMGDSTQNVSYLVEHAKTFYSVDQPELGNEALQMVLKQADSLDDSIQVSLRYQIAEVWTNNDEIENAIGILEGIGGGDAIEKKFVKQFTDRVAGRLLKGKITFHQAVGFAESLRTEEQKRRVLDYIVECYVYRGRISEARDFIANHVSGNIERNEDLESNADLERDLKYSAIMDGEEAFAAALETTDNDFHRDAARLQRARCEAWQGNYQRAMEWVAQFETRQSEWPYRDMAEVFAHLGQTQFAIRVLQEANDEESLSKGVNLLTRWLIKKKRNRVAAELLGDADKMKIGLKDLEWLCLAFRDDPGNENSISALLELQKVRPHSAQYDRLLAWCYAKRGAANKAIRHARIAKEKKDAEGAKMATTYEQLARWGIYDRILVQALTSAEPSMIRVATRFQRRQIKNIDLTKVEEIEALARSVRELPGPPEFKALALFQLAKFIQPDLEMYSYY